MLKDNIVFPERFPSVRGLCCAVSTRNGGVSPAPFGMNLSFNVGDDRSLVEENRRRFFQTLGIDLQRIAVPKQCHSATVAYAASPGAYDATDGLLTDQEDVWLVVSIADCLPVLVVDKEKRIVAGFHAGWRGSFAGIVSNGIGKMMQGFGVVSSDLHAFIGPSAAPCCYEVGAEVAAHFSEEIVERRDGKIYLDLKKENVRQLIARGVPSHQIEVNGSCTICNDDLFHSYRRDGERSGRMMAVIGLRG